MTSTTLSTEEFDQDPGRAKELAAQGPVYVTEGGKPAYVLLAIADDGLIEGETMRNPQFPVGRQSEVVPLREGLVRKGGLNRGPSQIKTRPPAPCAIPPRPSVVSALPMVPVAPDPTYRSR